MNDLIDIIRSHGLLEKSQEELNALKGSREPYRKGDVLLYAASLYTVSGALFCIAAFPEEKFLCIASAGTLPEGFTGRHTNAEGIHLLHAPLSPENAAALQRLFPFTAPVSLRKRRTTVGCGDRLGLASAGHLRAMRRFRASPVLAQQSIRELDYTGRSFAAVVADASFLVFQEGFEEGWGADGDHLKTIADIDAALQAGMPMITLDLTETLQPAAAEWDQERVEEEFAGLPEELRSHVMSVYADRRFTLLRQHIDFPAAEAMRCALMYRRALDFAAEADRHIRSRRGEHYDLEISIDETSSPTLPSHHLFIIRELLNRQVTVNSLAPRFVGDFQKAVDYIGDPEEFERQFAVHCDIAAAHGGYKISIHSGSDKFSVYPAIGRHTAGRLHLKTAGTNWLEAVHTIARAEPQLYRRLHERALASFPEALRSYHITADISGLPAADSLDDGELERFLSIPASRQMLHITYGGVLKDPELQRELFRALHRHEELHYRLLEEHLSRHLKRLGVERREGEENDGGDTADSAR
jgi:hypothetical protein